MVTPGFNERMFPSRQGRRQQKSTQACDARLATQEQHREPHTSRFVVVDLTMLRLLLAHVTQTPPQQQPLRQQQQQHKETGSFSLERYAGEGVLGGGVELDQVALPDGGVGQPGHATGGLVIAQEPRIPHQGRPWGVAHLRPHHLSRRDCCITSICVGDDDDDVFWGPVEEGGGYAYGGAAERAEHGRYTFRSCGRNADLDGCVKVRMTEIARGALNNAALLLFTSRAVFTVTPGLVSVGYRHAYPRVWLTYTRRHERAIDRTFLVGQTLSLT